MPTAEPLDETKAEKEITMTTSIERHVRSEPYRANDALAIAHLLVTIMVHLGIMWAFGRWPGLFWPLAGVQTGVFLRAFMTFHDCGHGSYFTTPAANRVMGVLIGWVIFQTANWSLGHAKHHQTSGQPENSLGYGWNETILFTKQKLEKKSPFFQRVHAVLRHPILFFTVVPSFVFMFVMRFDMLILNRYKDKSWALSLAPILMPVALLTYVEPRLPGYCWLYLAGLAMAASIGMMLFHLQHAFNPGYVKTGKDWSFRDAALIGSSFISVVPWWFRWATFGIEYHHIHHLSTKVPSYRLQACHEALPVKTWLDAGVVSLDSTDVWTSLWYTLYDTELEKFI